MKSFILFFLGFLFVFSYWPIIIFLGVSGIIDKLPKNNFIDVLVLSPQILFPVLGFILIQKSITNTLGKKSKELDKQIQNSVRLEDLNLIQDTKTVDSILEIEEKRKWLDSFIFKMYMLGLVAFVSAFVFNLFILVCVIGIVYFVITYNKYEQINYEVKSWLYKHKVNIPGIQNLTLVEKKQAEKLKNLLVTKKIVAQGNFSPSVDHDELLVFEYKQKKVALIDLSITTGSGKSRVSRSFICLTTKNPDKISGQTVTWSGGYWNFDLPHKVETESIKFDKIFKTVATSQIDARMHLATNVMQDMIDMYNSLENKQILFYFDDDDMYFIFSPSLKNTPSYFEFDFSKPVVDAAMDDDVVKCIEQCLKIFDDFWLDRKNYLR